MTAFFKIQKDEAGAVKNFKKTCTYHGLDVHVSLNALNALKAAVEATLKKQIIDMSDRNIHTLGRRGLIRVTTDGETKITELGLLVIALAEAGGLIITKARETA